MRFFLKSLVLSFGLFLLTGGVFAMTSTNYQIPWDNFNEGGTDFSFSANYKVNDTIGDISGTSTSANYNLSAGYRAAEIEDILSMTIRTQNNAVQTTYSAFSDVGNTVTVASTAGFSVGSLVAVVENVGFSEFVAVGEIVDITGPVITVDDWDGEPASMSAIPAGGNDRVYLMSSNAISLGTVSSTNENVAIAMSSILTDAPNGYSVYIQPNQLLQSASGTIMDTVTDGTVNLGSEEYGTENVGVTALNTGTDLGVTSTQRVVQTSPAETGGIADKIAMIYKLAIIGSTDPGTYTQTIFYTLTANF